MATIGHDILFIYLLLLLLFFAMAMVGHDQILFSFLLKRVF